MDGNSRIDSVPNWMARMVATITLSVAAAVLLGAPAWLLLLLLPDFLARALNLRRLSYLSAFGRLAVRPLLPAHWLRPRSRWAPKRFAAAIGSVFLGAAFGAYVAGAEAVGMGLLVALVVCASLEAGLGFCLGCRIYTALGRIGLVQGCSNVGCAIEPAEAAANPGEPR